jgi:hypothetical protein
VHNSPAPDKYLRSTDFDQNKSHKRGPSIGVSREQSPHKGYVLVDPLKNPGVGKYEVQKSFNMTSKEFGRYSMRMKYKDVTRTALTSKPDLGLRKKQKPGPGLLPAG